MKLLKRIILSHANKNNKNKISYLRKKGAIIGESTKLNCKVDSFGTEPYLISVGEKCLIAGGVRFFTHDGGISVLENLNYFEGCEMDKMARIKIGNNVYLGTGAFVLPGVTIGDNCIIGAGAIVTKDIPDNSVAVGVPARRIKSIDEYYEDALKRNYLYCTHNMNDKEKEKYLKENVSAN